MKKGKNSKFNRKFFLQAFIVLVIFLIGFLLFFYQNDIQYLVNGFGQIQDSSLQVYYFDVGQASSVMVVFPNDKTMIIDTGSNDSEDDFIANVNTVLKSNNLKKIDYLVLTHSDEDHVGGADVLLEDFQVSNVLRPKILSTSQLEVENSNYKVVTTQVYEDAITAIYEEPDCEVSFIETDVKMEGEETSVNFFACQKDNYTETNDYSPFIEITYNNKSFLFTGDATSDREQELIEYLSTESITMDIDFLFVAHHGSKYSTSEEFLSAISPEYAIISAGDELHPTEEVLDRLTASGVKEIYCTKTDGTIGVGVNENGTYRIKTMAVHIDLSLVVVLVCFAGFVIIFFIDKFFSKKKNKKDGI